MSRFLWSHDRIAYRHVVEVVNPDGSARAATPVEYDGKPMGHVSRAEIESEGWGYRAPDQQVFTVGFETRADAADHLLSACSPSAAWLS